MDRPVWEEVCGVVVAMIDLSLTLLCSITLKPQVSSLPPKCRNFSVGFWKGFAFLCHVCPGNAGDLTPSSPFWYL